MIVSVDVDWLHENINCRLGKFSDERTKLGLAGELIFIEYFTKNGILVEQSDDMFDQEKDLLITVNGIKKSVEIKTQYPLNSYKAFCEKWDHKKKLTSVDFVGFLSTRNNLNPTYGNPTEGNLYLLSRGFSYSKYYYHDDFTCSRPRILIPYDQPKCLCVGKIPEEVLEYLSQYNTKSIDTFVIIC